MPDLTQYAFTYETSTGSNVTGRIAQVTLPTGGTIKYVYPAGSIDCNTGGASQISRTESPGNGTAWLYKHSEGTSNTDTYWDTAVTDPTSNEVDTIYQPTQSNGSGPLYTVLGGTYYAYEVQRSTYQGGSTPNKTCSQVSNCLQVIDTCYNGAASPCTTTPVSLPITSITKTITWPGGLQSQTVSQFDQYGNLTSFMEYGYGSGGPGSLIRKTTTVYNTSLGSIVNLPSSTVVEDGGSNAFAKTLYSYDEFNPPSQSPPRGNLTTLQQFSNSSTPLTTHYYYTSAGQINKIVGPKNETTMLAWTFCNNSFLSKVTYPISSLVVNYAWDCDGDVLLTTQDENAQTWTTSYGDSYYWRPTGVADPTMASTAISYPTPATSVEGSLSVSSSAVQDSRLTLDGLGRPSISQVKQSVAVNTYDSVATTYDGAGRVYTVSQPYSAAAGSTTGVSGNTTTLYDGLGRPVSITDANGGYTKYTYYQNDVLVQIGPKASGENVKSRQLEYDALGRLTSVCEITGASPSGSCAQSATQSGFLTKYTYDPLNNLTGVQQGAQVGAGTTQTRTYTYDWLSRLISEVNPEDNGKTYSYDTGPNCAGSNGDLVEREDALANITCYSYDAMHRLIEITYPSGQYAAVTPSKTFVYDSGTGTNLKHRLASAYAGSTANGTTFS